MYIESAGKINATTALLEGPWMTTDNRECTMIFYYHMNGANVGGLNVQINIVAKKNPRLLWSVNGRDNATSDLWQQAIVPIGQRSLFRVSVTDTYI